MPFAFFDGFIVMKTRHAIGFAKEEDARPSIWISREHLGEVTYKKDGDKKELNKGERVEAVEIPRWLATDLKLKIDNE